MPGLRTICKNFSVKSDKVFSIVNIKDSAPAVCIRLFAVKIYKFIYFSYQKISLIKYIQTYYFFLVRNLMSKYFVFEIVIWCVGIFGYLCVSVTPEGLCSITIESQNDIPCQHLLGRKINSSVKVLKDSYVADFQQVIDSDKIRRKLFLFQIQELFIDCIKSFLG